MEPNEIIVETIENGSHKICVMDRNQQEIPQDFIRTEKVNLESYDDIYNSYITMFPDDFNTIIEQHRDYTQSESVSIDDSLIRFFDKEGTIPAKDFTHFWAKSPEQFTENLCELAQNLFKMYIDVKLGM